MATEIKAVIKLRRGTEAQRLAVIPTEGELVHSTNYDRVFVGDGTTTGGKPVGSLIFVQSEPPSTALIGDLFYDKDNSFIYCLTGTSPSDISSYRKLSQTADITQGYLNLSSDGVYSINVSKFTSTYLPLSGGKMGGNIDMDNKFKLLNYPDPIDSTDLVKKSYVDTLSANSVDGLNTFKTYVENKFVKKAGDTMTGALSVVLDGVETNRDALTLDNGNLDLNNNIIKNFSAKITSIDNLTSYTLQETDNGSVMYFSYTTNNTDNIIVKVPENLPVGFNVMIIQYDANSVYVTNDTINVKILQIDSKFTIRKQYGIANIVCIGENAYILSGDLI